nr:esterase [Listeria fleischmannii]
MPLIQVIHERIKNIPVLHIVKEKHRDDKLKTVIFYHGFQSQKELYLHYGYLLAEKGFRVILPDAHFHGERKGDVSEEEQAMFFWDTVENNIEELENIVDNLVARSLASKEAIGVGGVSMGAITSLGILAKYKWVKVAVSLMGSAYYGHFARGLVEQALEMGLEFPFDVNSRIASLNPYDLSEQIEKIGNRPLFLWHGKKDNVVPFAYSEKLYQVLTENKMVNNVEFIIDERAKHKVSIEGIEACVSFFYRYM